MASPRGMRTSTLGPPTGPEHRPSCPAPPGDGPMAVRYQGPRVHEVLEQGAAQLMPTAPVARRLPPQ